VGIFVINQNAIYSTPIYLDSNQYHAIRSIREECGKIIMSAEYGDESGQKVYFSGGEW